MIFGNGDFTFWLSFCDSGRKIEDKLQWSNLTQKCRTVITLILVKEKNINNSVKYGG